MDTEESAPQPGVWRDRAGYLWVESSPGRVFCYDDSARRRMGDRWPSQPLSEAASEFGPLEPLLPVAGGEDDRIVFLYGGGCSVEVPLSYGAARGWQRESAAFAEMVPGWSMAMVAQGHFWVNEHECVEGVFVVIRRAK